LAKGVPRQRKIEAARLRGVEGAARLGGDDGFVDEKQASANESFLKQLDMQLPTNGTMRCIQTPRHRSLESHCAFALCMMRAHAGCLCCLYVCALRVLSSSRMGARLEETSGQRGRRRRVAAAAISVSESTLQSPGWLALHNLMHF